MVTTRQNGLDGMSQTSVMDKALGAIWDSPEPATTARPVPFYRSTAQLSHALWTST